MQIIRGTIVGLLDFIDSRSVVRRGVLIFTLWMTWWVTSTMIEFAVVAMANKYPGLEVAAIVAAIMAPTAALQGFAFQQYLGSKQV